MVFRMLLLPVSPLLSASALLLDLNLRVTSHWQGESKCLGAFAKLRKGTLSFVMSVRPYVRLYNLAPPPNWMNYYERYIRVFFENMLGKKLKLI